MSSYLPPDIPSFRKQHLILEYQSLKLRCPAGVYLSLTPGNPSQWSGVLFVRTGPYSPAILRFNISFPPQYPDIPPVVNFATEIFHPLLGPLTTYIFSANPSDANGTVSAREEERLPPGGFSLRNGFPQWFDRKGRTAQQRADTTQDGQNGHHLRVESRDVSVAPVSRVASRDVSAAPISKLESRDVSAAPVAESLLTEATTPASITEVLAYLKSSFEDPALLDRLPLEAAANPGAWHAWRSHRGFSKGSSRAISPASGEQPNSPTDGRQSLSRDWNWDGVWENRVKTGIENSVSDPVLFGPKGGERGDKRNEMIRFSKSDNGQLKHSAIS